MSDYRICHLKDHDWQRWRSIRLLALSSAPAAFGSKLADEQALSDEQWQERHQRKDVATFVAQLCSDQADIGMVIAAPYEQDVGLFSLWVDSRYRRLGIGGVLVDFVIQWASNKNYRKLFLDVGKSNHTALQLYESKQFQRTGNTHQLDFGQGVIDECQMVLDLDSLR